MIWLSYFSNAATFWEYLAESSLLNSISLFRFLSARLSFSRVFLLDSSSFSAAMIFFLFTFISNILSFYFCNFYFSSFTISPLCFSSSSKLCTSLISPSSKLWPYNCSRIDFIVSSFVSTLIYSRAYFLGPIIPFTSLSTIFICSVLLCFS